MSDTGTIDAWIMNKSREKILNDLSGMGVVGAGGAGFPTHVKLNCTADIVIANGAECEPLLHKDKELMAAEPESIIRGMELAMRLSSASRGVIGIKRKAKSAIQALKQRVTPPMEIHLLDDTYPAGDEFVLAYEVTGRIPPAGGLPIHAGIVVQNVETLWWLGTGQPVTEKYLTVAGNVTPVTVKVPVGTPVSTVLTLAGWKPNDGEGILAGGVMMGRLLEDLNEPVDKTLGGIIVLPEKHPLLRRYRRPRSHGNRIARSACDQCNFCTQLCPRYLLGHSVQPHLAMRHIGMAPPGVAPPPGSRYCCGCQLCSFWSCPEDLDPGWVTFDYRQQLQSTESVEPVPVNSVHPLYEFRKPSISALKRRLGLHHFTDDAPLIELPEMPVRVTLPLKQHVGAPAEPVVSIGDHVSRGDLIGAIPEGALGAAVHASITGTVAAIDTSIVIEGE